MERRSPRRREQELAETESQHHQHQEDSRHHQDDSQHHLEDSQQDSQQTEQTAEQVDVKRKRGRPRTRDPGGNYISYTPKDLPPAIVDPADEQEDTGTFDESGEEKITRDGYLLGGREYKCKTFVLPRHPTRLYVISLEAAKAIGYKDAYILHLRNPHVVRITASDVDRQYLSSINELPSMYRNRALVICSARTMFRAFGHRIILRGRPIRDDYSPKDFEDSQILEESIAARYEDEDSDNGGDFMKRLGHEGPFKRHAPGVLRFGVLEEDDEPISVASDDLVADAWMMKCAKSAAAFNRRLNRTRPTSFLDLHTNIEQIPSITQPTRVRVEIEIGSEETRGRVDPDVIAKQAGDPLEPQWAVTVGNIHDAKYPLSIMRGQNQNIVPVFRHRFKDEQSSYHHPQTGPGHYGIKQVEHYGSHYGLDGPLADVMPMKVQINMKKVTIAMDNKAPEEPEKRKRGRPPKIPGQEAPIVCCHCNNTDAPLAVSEAFSDAKIPRSLLLTCAECATKHHPLCIEIDDPVLISKINTYDWHCSSCKACSTCQDPVNDESLLFCDTCDRGYHTYCLDPPLEHLPEGSWLCPECAKCSSCEKPVHVKKGDAIEDVLENVVLAPAAQVKNEIGTYLTAYCKDCFADFEADRYCPFCLGVYQEDTEDSEMACCDVCERWVHVGCDPLLTQSKYEKLTSQKSARYVCSLCDEDQRLTLLLTRRALPDGKYLKLVEYKKHMLFAPGFVSQRDE